MVITRVQCDDHLWHRVMMLWVSDRDTKKEMTMKQPCCQMVITWVQIDDDLESCGHRMIAKWYSTRNWLLINWVSGSEQLGTKTQLRRVLTTREPDCVYLRAGCFSRDKRVLIACQLRGVLMNTGW